MKECECCYYSERADCEKDLLVKEIGEELIQKLKAYKNQQGDIWGKSIVQGAIDIIKEYYEVDDEVYEGVTGDTTFRDDERKALNAIRKGTVLPEHHGRLLILDEEKVEQELTPLSFSSQRWISEVGLSNSTVTILEAKEQDTASGGDYNLQNVPLSDIDEAIECFKEKLGEGCFNDKELSDEEIQALVDAEMKLVIDIPESIYKEVMSGDWSNLALNDFCKAIENGVPLPKGHGDLKDSKFLDTRLNFVLNHTGGYKNTPIGTGIVIAMAEILDAPTIIKADKEKARKNHE